MRRKLKMTTGLMSGFYKDIFQHYDPRCFVFLVWGTSKQTRNEVSSWLGQCSIVKLVNRVGGI